MATPILLALSLNHGRGFFDGSYASRFQRAYVDDHAHFADSVSHGSANLKNPPLKEDLMEREASSGNSLHVDSSQ